MIGHSLWLEIIQKMLYILWFSNNQVELNADKCYLHRNSKDLNYENRLIMHKTLFMRKVVRHQCRLSVKFGIPY